MEIDMKNNLSLIALALLCSNAGLFGLSVTQINQLKNEAKNLVNDFEQKTKTDRAAYANYPTVANKLNNIVLKLVSDGQKKIALDVSQLGAKLFNLYYESLNVANTFLNTKVDEITGTVDDMAKLNQELLAGIRSKDTSISQLQEEIASLKAMNEKLEKDKSNLRNALMKPSSAGAAPADLTMSDQEAQKYETLMKTTENTLTQLKDKNAQITTLFAEQMGYQGEFNKMLKEGPINLFTWGKYKNDPTAQARYYELRDKLIPNIRQQIDTLRTEKNRINTQFYKDSTTQIQAMLPHMNQLMEDNHTLWFQVQGTDEPSVIYFLKAFPDAYNGYLDQVKEIEAAYKEDAAYTRPPDYVSKDDEERISNWMQKEREEAAANAKYVEEREASLERAAYLAGW